MQTARVSKLRMGVTRSKPHIYRSDWSDLWFTAGPTGKRYGGDTPAESYATYLRYAS